MTKQLTNPQVDVYLSNAKQWQVEMGAIRSVILDTMATESGLVEELKWAKPCYAFEGKNIAVIQGFKAYCALLFFKGALLKDPHGLLVKTGENTQAGRQLRFTNVKDIVATAPILSAYIHDAIAVEKTGLTLGSKDKTPLLLTEELLHLFSTEGGAELKAAFEALTPGRQRAYHFYFSAPKQSKTREARIEKCRQQILNGKGLNG